MNKVIVNLLNIKSLNINISRFVHLEKSVLFNKPTNNPPLLPPDKCPTEKNAR